MAGEPLTCQELVELVTDYSENALGPADRPRFDAHVAECPGCDIYLRQMQTTLELVGATAGLETDPRSLRCSTRSVTGGAVGPEMIEVRMVLRGEPRTHRFLRARLTFHVAATLVIDAVATAAMYMLEHDDPRSGFDDIGGALIWVSAQLSRRVRRSRARRIPRPWRTARAAILSLRRSRR